MPRIRKFTAYIDDLDAKMLEMTAVIAKFDENLSLKANKNLLAHTLKEFESAYLRKEDQQTGMDELENSF